MRPAPIKPTRNLCICINTADNASIRKPGIQEGSRSQAFRSCFPGLLIGSLSVPCRYLAAHRSPILGLVAENLAGVGDGKPAGGVPGVAVEDGEWQRFDLDAAGEELGQVPVADP